MHRTGHRRALKIALAQWTSSMRAYGLRGTEVPVHVEHRGVSNKRRRSGRDVTHMEFVVFEDGWFDRAHVAQQPFLGLVADAGHALASNITQGHTRSANCF